MSLAEIALDFRISRQAASELLNRATKTMQDYEDKLHMIKKFKEISLSCSVLEECFNKENFSKDIKSRLGKEIADIRKVLNM